VMDFKVTQDDAIRLLADKLKQNGATIDDILAICTLLPGLLPLVKSCIRRKTESVYVRRPPR